MAEDDFAAIRSLLPGGQIRLLTLTGVFNKLGGDTQALAVAAQRGLLDAASPGGEPPPVQ